MLVCQPGGAPHGWVYRNQPPVSLSHPPLPRLVGRTGSTVATKRIDLMAFRLRKQEDWESQEGIRSNGDCGVMCSPWPWGRAVERPRRWCNPTTPRLGLEMRPRQAAFVAAGHERAIAWSDLLPATLNQPLPTSLGRPSDAAFRAKSRLLTADFLFTSQWGLDTLRSF